MPQIAAPVEAVSRTCQTAAMRLQVDLFADLVCPWCFIGTKTLATAALRTDVQLDIHWRPFLLHPRLAEGGAPYREFVEQKFGRPYSGAFRKVRAAGEEVGIEFAFDRIQRMPDTSLAHAAIGYATGRDQQAALVQRLFEAHFIDGIDIGDVGAVAELALEVGMASDVETRLADDSTRQRVRDAAEAALDMGVTGVPFYMIGGWPAQGSQDAATLARVIDKAAAKQRAKLARTS